MYTRHNPKYKILFFFIMFCLPLYVKAQIHLGETLSFLKAHYPKEIFKIEYATDTKKKYTTMSNNMGEFTYVFDNKTGLINLIIQVPKDLRSLNIQVETYNNNYETISENLWKVGDTIEIKLFFSDNVFVFYYY